MGYINGVFVDAPTRQHVEQYFKNTSPTYPTKISGVTSGVDVASRETRGLSGGSGSSSRASTPLPGMSTLDDYFKRLQAISEANNAWSAAQAQKQMDFQAASADKAMKFNHDEAELSRLWQERMSNTAHQREIKDLQAAGLNPVLSAMGGSGAPVTSGATASGYSSQGAKGDTDTSLAPALVSLLGSFMSAQASMMNTITSANAQERIAQLGANTDIFRSLTSASSAREVANIQGTTSRDVANIQGRNSMIVAGIQGETSRVVAQIGAGATVSSARIHAAGQAAAAQISGQYNLSVAKTNQLSNILTHAMDNASKEGIAVANRRLQRDLQKNDFDFRMSFAEDQYTRDWKLHMWDNGTDLLQSLIGAIGSSGYGSTGSGLLGLLKYFG
nr:MAG: DNA pilot protein [Microviridae sp.]USL90310.1 MAG: DNA pilot protein [Microviridae sp.]